MSAIERIRAALNAASCGPWIGAGPSFGRPLPKYLDSVVQDCSDGDCSIAICRDTETSDASYIAACNPSAMSEVLAHIDTLEAENERLRTESEERLQNCAALIAENERLRKDAERLDWMQRQDLDELSFGILQDQPGDGDYVVWAGPNVCAGKTFRDAIDAAMKGEKP